MARRSMLGVNFAVALAALGVFALACGNGTDADPKSGRLSRSMAVELESGGGLYQACYYDASVTLDADGRILTVAEQGETSGGRIEPGKIVEGAKEVFPQGAAIPVPVHIDGDAVRGSYAFCEKIIDSTAAP